MPFDALHIELLHDCPSRCLACDHRRQPRARLSSADLRAVYALPGLRQLRLVSFSGGEPLLYTGLAAALSGAAAAFPGAGIVLLSSLYSRKKVLALLRRLPAGVRARLHIGSSLDGPEAMHDRMRGRPGAFMELKASAAAIRQHFPSLSAGLTFTATRRNAGLFFEAWLEARAMSLPLAPQFLVPNGGTSGLELDAAARAAFASGLRKALSESASESEASPLRQALDFLDGGPAGPCGAGRSFLMLAPEGEFYFCPFRKDLRAPLDEPGRLLSAAGGGRHCSACFLRCARRPLI